MDWKYLFTSLEGRIGRQSYWMGVIAMTVITIVAALLDVVLGTMKADGVGVKSESCCKFHLARLMTA